MRCRKRIRPSTLLTGAVKRKRRPAACNSTFARPDARLVIGASTSITRSRRLIVARASDSFDVNSDATDGSG